MKFKVQILKSKNEFDEDSAKEIIQEVWASDEHSLLEILLKNKIQIDHSCGGHATCGTCQIELIKGDLSEKEDLELEFATDRAMKDNERLSCQSHPKSDLTIRIKNQTKT